MGVREFVDDYYTNNIQDALRALLIANSSGTSTMTTNDLWMAFFDALESSGLTIEATSLNGRQKIFLATYSGVDSEIEDYTLDDLWGLVTGPYVPL